MKLTTRYKCYLNGKFYGSGGLDYMRELFVDYVVTCKMYDANECEFKIIKETKKVKSKKNANDKLATWLEKL